MKMKLLLVLSGVLCVCAEGFHEDVWILGCSDSEAEFMYGTEAGEIRYADFQQGRDVDALPDFADHPEFPGFYESAVTHRRICRENLKLRRRAMEEVPLEPDPPSSLVIYNRDEVELGKENSLICHVSGFYPAPVHVYWTKNGENVTEGTSINIPFPKRDGSFTQISRLDFTPQLGDIYSCTVEHLALTQPLTRIWDVEKTQPGIGPAVFCGLGLTVGLLGVAAGTFFLIKGNECS